MNDKLCILIRISLKFVPKGPIDNKSAFIQVMAWRWTGAKPLSEPKLAQFTEAYVALGGDELTQCGLVMLYGIRFSDSIDSDNAMVPDRCQAISWTKADLSIEPSWTKFSEIKIKTQTP